jgi:putative ABC transport system permease protein
MFQEFAVELKHAWRGLLGRRAASVGAVLVLTLGVGLTSAIFAIADPFLLRPLPYADPENLAFIRIERKSRDVTGPPPTLAAWAARTDLFQGVAAFGQTSKILTTGAEGARSFREWAVSPEFLPLLYGASRRVALAPPGTSMPLLVTESMARAFTTDGNSPIGTPLRSEIGEPLEIAGILPARFLFPQRTSQLDAISIQDFPGLYWRNVDRWSVPVTVLARLQRGLTPDRLSSALAADPANVDIRITEVRDLREHMTGSERPLAAGALAAGLLIALVCVANVMNLQVARGVYRAPEFATRQALGAPRAALIRLVGWELAVLGVFTVGTSLLLAQLVLLGVTRLTPESYVALGDVRVTGRVIVFASVLSIAMAALCAPVAWFSVRRAMVSVGLRAQQDAPGSIRMWRFALVAGQAAIATGLVTGAVLLFQSYVNLWSQDTGYSSHARLLTVAYPRGRTQADLARSTPATVEALRRVPGVSQVAAGIQVGRLVDGYGIAGVFTVSANGRSSNVAPSLASPGFFGAVGTRLLIGRDFTEGDRYGEVVVLNQASARRLWPGAPLDQVVGQPVKIDGQIARVIGVVQDAFDQALDTAPASRAYSPIRWDRVAAQKIGYAIRATGTTLTLSDLAIRRAVAGVDPDAVVESFDSPTDRLAATVKDRTFATLVLAIFSAACLGVTAAGICAVVAFVAARRTREIAIRMALGAEPRHVRGLVVNATLLAMTTGVVIGAVGSRWIAGVLSSQLYGVSAGDPRALLAAVALLIALSALAVLWPVRRAVRLEPTTALRTE